jgi:hypothetical protein
VTLIAQVAPERPTSGDIARITYRSRQSGSVLTAQGPVTRFETVEREGQPLYEVCLKQQTNDYDPATNLTATRSCSLAA